MARSFTAASSQSAVQASAVVTATPVTLACWFNGAGSGSRSMLAVDDGATGSHWFLLRLLTDGNISAVASAASSDTTGGSSNGAWNHGAAVFTSTTSRTAYLNGVAATTNTTSSTPTGLTQTQIGKLATATQFMDGLVAEAAIWNIALVAGEIVALSKGVSPLMIRPTSLVSYWPLYGNESPERDRWKTRADLTLNNAPTKADHCRVYMPSRVRYGPSVRAVDLSASLAFTLGIEGNLRMDHALTATMPMTLTIAPMLTGDYSGPALYVFVNDVSVATGRSDDTLRVLRDSFTIDDISEDAPNTCSFDAMGFVPHEGERVVAMLGGIENPQKLFTGTILQVTQHGTKEWPRYAVNAIDDTWMLTHRRVTTRYLSTPASDIIADLIAIYMPGFTTTHVEADLDSLEEITFTNEVLSTCLTRVAQRIGANWYVEDKDIHFYLTEAGLLPDDVTLTHDSANDIRVTRDIGQIVTRVVVEGGGANAFSGVMPGDTKLPVVVIDWYPPLGGVVRSGPQPITYGAVVAGTAGSLVGPGAAPASAPVATLAGGAGIESGAHEYAAVFKTASGQSIPGPRRAITVGTIAAPATAPALSLANVGSGPDPGSHRWAVTFVTAAGETTASPLSSSLTTTAWTHALAPSLIQGVNNEDWFDGVLVGTMTYTVGFRTAVGGETELVTTASIVCNATGGGGGGQKVRFTDIPLGPPGTAERVVYRLAGGSYKTLVVFNDNTTQDYLDNTPDASLGALAPTQVGGGTAFFCLVTLSAIPIGGSLVTARKIYRTAANGVQLKHAFTLNNNSAVAAGDSVRDADLGANVPTTNTAAANQVALSSIPIGPAGTTDREIYRTPIGSAQLELVTTIAGNTATTYTDSTPDASLGANAPASDTSGLTQPAGQVLAGVTSIPVAGVGSWADPDGGWAVIGNGEQVVRYFGITDTHLTGIPATGPGSVMASIGYNSTVTAAPMLVGIPASGAGSIQFEILRGDEVNLLVTVDDEVAQAAIAAVIGDGHDGIIEEYVQDRRLSYTEATARGQALLALRGSVEVQARYTSRDPKTKSGRDVQITLPDPWNVSQSFRIQRVTISNFHPNIFPRYDVMASTSKFSYDELLRIVRTQNAGAMA